MDTEACRFSTFHHSTNPAVVDGMDKRRGPDAGSATKTRKMRVRQGVTRLAEAMGGEMWKRKDSFPPSISVSNHT